MNMYFLGGKLCKNNENVQNFYLERLSTQLVFDKWDTLAVFFVSSFSSCWNFMKNP